MKRAILGMSTLAVLVAAGTAMAVQGTSQLLHITAIEEDPDNSGSSNGAAAYLTFDVANATNKPSCAGWAPSVGVMLANSAWGYSPDHLKAEVSLATAAFLAGRQVTVNWDGNCYNGHYASISNIKIQ